MANGSVAKATVMAELSCAVLDIAAALLV